jgi:Flp pilus assembly protein TadG
MKKKIALFKKNASGGIAIMFALLLLPVMGLIGLLVDYSAAANARTQLQTHADTIAQTLSLKAHKDPEWALLEQARVMLRQHTAYETTLQDFTVKRLQVNAERTQIRMELEARYKTAFGALFGKENMDVSAETLVTAPPYSIDVF